MKELVALTFLIVLVVLGWNQSYKNHFDSLVGNPPPATPAPVTPPPVSAGAPAGAPAIPATTPAPTGSWMWGKTTGPAPLSPPGKLGGKHGH